MFLNYIHWNIDPEIVNVFGVSIRYYGLFFVGGLVACVLILGWIFKKEQLPSNNVEKLAVYGLIGLFAGARLGHCLFYEPAYYLSHPLEMLLPITFLPNGGVKFIGYQGLASHGGALGLFIALIIYSCKTKHSLIDIIDLIAVAAALGSGFIRIGNLFNSEIIGIPTTQTWGFVFERVDQVPRHPAQLYEAISYFLIFALTITLYKTKRDSLKNGFFLGLTLTLIFIARFFIEFIKEKQVAFEADMLLNMGQILSIPYIVLGIFFLIRGIVKTRKMNI